jgi:hypothetical protein
MNDAVLTIYSCSSNKQTLKTGKQPQWEEKDINRLD